jgi:N-acetylglucosamine transport system substrate-binding protein
MQNALDRRQFLVRSGLISGLALTGTMGLTSCATSGGSKNGSQNTAAAGLKSAANPFGVSKTADGEIVVPSSGYGLEWAKQDIAAFNKAFPGPKIKMSVITDMVVTMQARFLKGNPPDFVLPAELDTVTLAGQHQLTDLTEFYNTPALGFPGLTIGDSMLPGAVDAAKITGDKPLVVQYAYLVEGIWYSKKIFDERGWAYPKTWDEMLALCAEIKKAGMAPLAYQGKYPSYLVWPLLMMAIKADGREAMNNIDNLEPNAWSQPGIKAAAAAIAELRGKGYFLPGTEALSHTESQTYWAQGKAAMIPCGGWLENEMGDVIPKDFQVTMAPTPSLTRSDKMPFETIAGGATGGFFVPAQAKNPALGLEFMREMLSKEGAARFAKLTKTLVSVKDYAGNLDISPGFNTQAALAKNAGENVLFWKWEGWYAEMSKSIRDVTGALASGVITADQFCKKAQSIADATAKDTTIVKQHV